MAYDVELKEDEAAIYFLGQAGYFIKSCGRAILIDPYLSDYCGRGDKRFSRLYPVSVDPKELFADIFIVTHDHNDHLDPETIMRYGIDKDTIFVAPHLTVKHLRKLGIPDERITVIDCGETSIVREMEIAGIFALGTSKDSIDTTGYKIGFRNGKTIYHTADTTYCELLEKSAEYADVILACINGKQGNMNVEQAAKLAKILDVKYAIPNHYDVMALNSENPELFRYLCEVNGIGDRCRILEVGKPFVF
ncbi:MAG: MBL fold metallo-hydrolase [Oscillospiraceae bacterium]|nr:MBL fold metallo-hydrolase [Oscillospiraceae bacterium]